jgi:hypothetical protein
MPTKQCSKCKKIKELDQFNKNKKTKSGLRWECRECQRISGRAYEALPPDPASNIRTCRICRIEKELDCYYKASHSKDGYNKICIDCNRSVGLINKYGVTMEEYDKMLKSQNGVCAICLHPETLMRRGKIVPLFVDHCHKTGKIRGLLCYPCNSAVGYLKDNPESFDRASSYLRSSGFMNKKAPGF